MKNWLSTYIEKNEKIRMMEIILISLLILGSVTSLITALAKTTFQIDKLTYKNEYIMQRNFDNEDYDDDCTICDVVFVYQDKEIVISYSYEEYESLTLSSIVGYEYECNAGVLLYFDHLNPTQDEITSKYQETIANQKAPVFNLAISLFVLAISFGVIYCFGKMFTTYEKVWFISIMVLATVFACVFPEESANGVSGIIIMLLYLLDTFFNILCELLISKQSRYNFLVSILVEITEILICVVLMYRFATLTSTLFFWLPIDIISYINWSKHKDEQEEELTIVRRLKGYQEILIIVGIVIWTIVVGYLISGLNISTDFFGNKKIETIVAYVDACASAVGICNGLFIFFRLQEQWIAWYICAILETAINIISGQYVLLILKLGYFTNTTYGFIQWNKYIKERDNSKVIETNK